MLILVKKKKMQRSAIMVKRLIENHVFHSWKNSIKVEKEILSERVRVFPSKTMSERGSRLPPVSRGK